MPAPLSNTYIECERCGKTIQKKGTRVLCVHCTNIRNREISKKYREENAEHVSALQKARYERVKRLKKSD